MAFFYTVTYALESQITLAADDELYISRNGSLLFDGNGAAGAITSSSGSGTYATHIAVDGTVFSSNAAVYIDDIGYLYVTVGESGAITGTFGQALTLMGNNDDAVVNIVNDGSITSPSSAIGVTPGGLATDIYVRMDNSGEINGGITGFYATTGSQDFQLTNTGTIVGTSYDGVAVYGQGTREVVNAGLIFGGRDGLYLGNSGDGQISNTGTILGEHAGVNAVGALSLINSGLLQASAGPGVNAHSTLILRNSGEIVGGGSTAIYAAGTAQVANSGTITGDVALVSAGSDFIWNAGLILGSVSFGGGADIYAGRFGGTSGAVYGGDGNDTLWGGSDEDTLMGGNDNDRLFGRAGDDTIEGGLGTDMMWGGRGEDTFVFTSANDSGLSANADRIFGFTRGEDLIDLEALNLDRFIGSKAFTGNGPEARVVNFSLQNLSVLQIDSDGNGKVDMAVFIYGAGFLNAHDLIL